MLYSNPSSTVHRGIFYALISALLFGISMPFAKYFLSTLNPWLLTGLFYLGSGLIICVILIFLFLYKPNLIEPSLKRNEWSWLMLSTLFGGIIAPVLWMFGLQKTTAATASLLLNFEAVFTALVAWFIFKEHTSRRLIFGLILIVLGGGALAGTFPIHGAQGWGYLLITGACLMWALDNNFTRHIATANPLIIVAVKSIAGGLVSISVAFFSGIKFSGSLNVFFSSLGIGALSYGLSLACFILALRHIGTGRTSAYFSSAPFIGALLSVIFLKEAVSIQLLLAAGLMGLGIWLHLTEYHDHKHTHESLIHEHLHTHDEHHEHNHLPADPTGEPHSHLHEHKPLRHGHRHYPDSHHRHTH